AVEYADTGSNTILVSSVGDGVEAEDMGPEGSILHGVTQALIPAGGARTGLHFVAFASDRQQARLYSSLAKLKDL
ncbi:MAG: hypothetical protein M3281_08435, partial [Chloroflexota bacterium]|nr:hypothetical protein [Chloroflexota bacterium]